MSGHRKYNTSAHATTTRTVVMCSTCSGSTIFLLATVLLLVYLPASEASTSCTYNKNGSCSVSAYEEDLTFGNHSIQWKIRPQNIGFMYYLRTSDDGDDLSVRGIVKWKVHLKNWSPNDTLLDGFLVTIMEHDTNETVTSYQLSLADPFELFAKNNEVLEMRLEFDDVLIFDRRYDAKITLLPIGKQAAASSFLSIMGKLKGKPCSEMKGLAERWAPHVMVNVYETTSQLEVSWKPAPQLLCISTYEVVLQNRDGVILNTTEIEVTPGQKVISTSFGRLAKDQTIQVKVRGKNAIDGGCACVNCNCITDKTKYFVIPDIVKLTPNETTSQIPFSLEQTSGPPILLIFGLLISLSILLICGCLARQKRKLNFWKKKIAFDSLKNSQCPNKKARARKYFKVMLVCPEITGRDHDYMMRISEALRNSNNTVVCDRWKECFAEAEENMLHWVYEQTKKAEKIVVFHSTSYEPRCGVYDIINNFFPATDPRLAHISLSSEVPKNYPREVEYVMPRDQQLLEDAYDIRIPDPLVIDVPRAVVIEETKIYSVSLESIEESSPGSTKTHSTDSGVASMTSNSSGSHDGLTDSMQTAIDNHLKELNNEKHPLLRQPIPV